MSTRELNFGELAKEVNKIYTALNDLKLRKSLEVMSISTRGRSPYRQNNWRNGSDTGSRSQSRSKSRERRVCYRCGRQGHIKKQCRASAKTVKNYKKFLQRHNESRSQSRERRSVSFKNEH